MKTVALVLALNVIFPVITIVGTRTAFGYAKTRSNSMGFICAALNIIMYGSPLSAIVSLSTFLCIKLYITHIFYEQMIITQTHATTFFLFVLFNNYLSNQP